MLISQVRQPEIKLNRRIFGQDRAATVSYYWTLKIKMH